MNQLKCQNHPNLTVQFLCQEQNCKQNLFYCEECKQQHTNHFTINIQQLLDKINNIHNKRYQMNEWINILKQQIESWQNSISDFDQKFNIINQQQILDQIKLEQILLDLNKNNLLIQEIYYNNQIIQLLLHQQNENKIDLFKYVIDEIEKVKANLMKNDQIQLFQIKQQQDLQFSTINKGNGITIKGNICKQTQGVYQLAYGNLGFDPKYEYFKLTFKILKYVGAIAVGFGAINRNIHKDFNYNFQEDRNGLYLTWGSGSFYNGDDPEFYKNCTNEFQNFYEGDEVNLEYEPETKRIKFYLNRCPKFQMTVLNTKSQLYPVVVLYCNEDSVQIKGW